RLLESVALRPGKPAHSANSTPFRDGYILCGKVLCLKNFIATQESHCLTSSRNLSELIDPSQRNRHLRLHHIAGADLLRLVGGDDALERPTEVVGQLDAIVLRDAAPEVFLQIQVPLVRRVEIQRDYNLAGIDE